MARYVGGGSAGTASWCLRGDWFCQRTVLHSEGSAHAGVSLPGRRTTAGAQGEAAAGFAHWGWYSPTGSACGRRGRALAAGLTGAGTPECLRSGGGGAASSAVSRRSECRNLAPGGGGASALGVRRRARRPRLGAWERGGLECGATRSLSPSQKARWPGR